MSEHPSKEAPAAGHSHPTRWLYWVVNVALFVRLDDRWRINFDNDGLIASASEGSLVANESQSNCT